MREQTIYGAFAAAKGDPTGRQKFYQLYQGDAPNRSASAWRGPYRDETDAEAAAEAEAKRLGMVIVWRN